MIRMILQNWENRSAIIMFVLHLIYYVSIKTVQLLRKHVSEEGDNSLLADDVEQLLSA